jgi:hypothetical protein
MNRTLETPRLGARNQPFSNGNEAVIIKDKASLADIKGQNFNLVDGPRRPLRLFWARAHS